MCKKWNIGVQIMRFLPSESYELTLDDGSEVIVDFSIENDLTRICFQDESYIDAELMHRKITDVYDIDQESHIVESEFFIRAKRYLRANLSKERIVR